MRARSYANADAIRHYELALQTLDADGGDAPMLLEVHERSSDVLAPVGQSADAMQHLSAASTATRAAAIAIAQARVLRKLAALHWEAGARDEAGDASNRVWRLIDQAPPHIERARLYQEMGQLAFRSGDNAGAMRWAERALERVERLATGAVAPGDNDAARDGRARSR